MQNEENILGLAEPEIATTPSKFDKLLGEIDEETFATLTDIAIEIGPAALLAFTAFHIPVAAEVTHDMYAGADDYKKTTGIRQEQAFRVVAEVVEDLAVRMDHIERMHSR